MKHLLCEVEENHAEEIVNDWNKQNPTKQVEETDQIHEHDDSFVLDWCDGQLQSQADHAYDCWKDEQMEKSM